MLNMFRKLAQMWRYHSSLDVERALRSELWRGIEIGKTRQAEIIYGREIAPSDYSCEHDTPLLAIAPGVFTCTLCRDVQPVARPTINLRGLDVEHVTEPGRALVRAQAERPLFGYRQLVHPDKEAGTDTQVLRALRKKG
jgi:hypothetical protein